MESRLMLQAARAAQFRVGQDWVLTGEFLGFEYGSVLMHGWLKKRVRKGIWVRRWFSIHPYGVCQCRDPMAFSGRRQLKLRARGLDVDGVEVAAVDRLCFRLRGPRKAYVLKAPTTYLRDKWMDALREWLEEVARQQREGGGLDDVPEDDELPPDPGAEDRGHDAHEHELFARPRTPAQWAVRVLTLPVLLPIYVSMPAPQRSPELYVLTIALSTAWLAVCSFLMASAADTAGCLMRVSSAVIGLTVGAAGTSLPNMFASMLVARQGCVRPPAGAPRPSAAPVRAATDARGGDADRAAGTPTWPSATPSAPTSSTSSWRSASRGSSRCGRDPASRRRGPAADGDPLGRSRPPARAPARGPRRPGVDRGARAHLPARVGGHPLGHTAPGGVLRRVRGRARRHGVEAHGARRLGVPRRLRRVHRHGARERVAT